MATNLILLALDDTQTLQLLERALKAASYTVAIVHDQKGLDISLQETSPALVVIGEHLKGINGLDISKSTLERFPTLPIVLFAEKDSIELIKRALHIGLSDCLFPPLRINEITEAIRRSQMRAQHMGDWVRREVKHTTASLERRITELETLVKLGHEVTSSLNLDSVLTSVVSAAVQLTGAEEGNLLLLDEESGELYMRASYNFEEKFAQTFRLKVQDSLAGQVVKTGEAVHFSDNEPQKIKTAYLVHALIYVPLRIQDHIIGVLGVDNRQSQRPFAQHHVLLMSVLADYAAIAVENARLYQKSEVERSKLDTTLENIADGVIVLDTSRRILLINPAARRAFGLGNADLTGKLVLDVIHHDEFRVLLDTGLATANLLKQHEINLDDGRVFNAQYTPVTGVGWAITMQEITNLKMLDRIKTDFIHTVSHDLRSPLTAVMGYIELLERVGPLTDQQKEFTHRVLASVQNITALVNDLLDLGRIEAGFDSGKDTVSLHGVLNYTLDTLASQINEKNQIVETDVSLNLPPVGGNPIRLRQMFDNLLSNAIKYTPPSGKIYVGMHEEDGQIILEIRDTGVGIPLPDQPHVFEKFYRASNAPKGTPGSGLGLAIVKSIVDSHSGRIWVESTAGKGTTFFVVLPIRKAAEEEASAISKAPNSPGN
jgi:two-component system phosphate regulon sensor histidine kinase PhoR